MKTLYPDISPFNSDFLIQGSHKIYFEESGNPDGKPVVFLHGGPGGGGDINVRRFFNPELYRIVNFDQRGCGRSKPHGPVSYTHLRAHETSQDLVCRLLLEKKK